MQNFTLPSGATPSALPTTIRLAIASSSVRPPEGDDWLRILHRGEVLHPQIDRPLSRVFALAGDIRPERVIAADLLYAERGAGGVHLVAEALHPIRVRRASSR